MYSFFPSLPCFHLSIPSPSSSSSISDPIFLSQHGILLFFTHCFLSCLVLRYGAIFALLLSYLAQLYPGWFCFSSSILAGFVSPCQMNLLRLKLEDSELFNACNNVHCHCPCPPPFPSLSLSAPTPLSLSVSMSLSLLHGHTFSTFTPLSPPAAFAYLNQSQTQSLNWIEKTDDSSDETKRLASQGTIDTQSEPVTRGALRAGVLINAPQIGVL